MADKGPLPPGVNALEPAMHLDLREKLTFESSREVEEFIWQPSYEVVVGDRQLRWVVVDVLGFKRFQASFANAQ